MRKLNRPQEPLGYREAVARFIADYPPKGKVTESRRCSTKLPDLYNP